MSHELVYMSATEMAAAIRSRRVGVFELIQAHVARCERVNPAVNAIVTDTYEQALQKAKQADSALARGETPGPLFGIPVAHKDSFLTQGVRTTHGSALLADRVPDKTSVAVARQLAAGAISLGKTNLPEFAAGSHTFNALFGATRNPYALGLSSGGSSGGSAAALAAGLVALADGTDMGGSLRNPASFCNVVGLRPSIGCVPVSPTEFPFNTLSVAGPMGRSVDDVALLLQVMAGADGADPLSVPMPAGGYASLQDIDPRGVRIALSPTLGGLPMEPAVAAALQQGVAHLQAMGCIVEDDEPDFRDADFAFETMRALSFVTNYGELHAARGAEMKDTVQWNIAKGLGLSGAEVAEAERARGRMFRRMKTLLERHDFLVAPVVQVLPFPVEQEYPQQLAGREMSSYIEWMRSCTRISITGHPAISLPCGFTADGVPIGIQIVGRYRQERELLEFARQFESANPAGLRGPELK